MSWSTKNKIPQSGDDEEIVTPDGLQILVGANEDLVLLWQIAFSNWIEKTKTVSTPWSLKSKTVS